MLSFMYRGVIDVMKGIYVMADPFFACYVRERKTLGAEYGII